MAALRRAPVEPCRGFRVEPPAPVKTPSRTAADPGAPWTRTTAATPPRAARPRARTYGRPPRPAPRRGTPWPSHRPPTSP
ncbi:hypothetical protein D7Y23_25705 [Corallococcus sp. AB050B]|nr:hypothetical protein D7Y23_25705 [Corallococcus sp. AB050B]